MNILDYMDWRGDLSFAQSPFCDVDNLIFSELAYTDFSGIAEGDSLSVTLGDAAKKVVLSGRSSGLVNDPLPLLEKIPQSRRFSTVLVGGYTNRVEADKGVQFSAVTFLLEDGTLYVAYRGTDSTLVGWQEDFNFAFCPETPGQTLAVQYLNDVAERFPTAPILVGGHSKGGNFAVFAAAFCKDEVKHRLRLVYSNDGPGFHRSIAESAEYRSIADRTVKIIPESSIVGILLNTQEKMTVISSDAKGVWQHNPYAWCVLGNAFVTVDERSFSSLFFDDTLREFLDHLSDEQRKTMVDAIFRSLNASGAHSLHEMNENKWEAYNAVARAASQLDPEIRRELMDDLKKLAHAGKDAFWNETKKSFEKKNTEK